MKVAGLLDGAAPRVRTVPASAPFLDVLVAALLDATPRDDPFALADAIIFLPNRRAASGLIAAFAARLGGAALLPSIRPLGDLDDDPDVWGPEPIALAAPPEIPPLRRRFELAALVRRRDAAEGGIDDPVRALAWADELCRLLDGAATVGAIDWAQLDKLVDGDLAQHWRRSSDFLKIISAFWPLHLKENGVSDPAARRALVLETLAAEWTARPPQKPVIIAGSTGSVAATRTLMRCVAALPKGCVVLPGLDTELDAAWEGLDEQHPQYGLSVSLAALGLQREEVAALPWQDSDTARARRRLVSESLAPARVTADWRSRLEAMGGQDLVAQAAQGLAIVEARNEAEEALAIATAMRETLETPGRTAALVTPDGALVRRVQARLLRWNITPQSSIGLPLAETPHGVLLALLGTLAADPGDPVALSALLAHPLASMGLTLARREHLAAAWGRALLRGPRLWRTLPELIARTQRIAADDTHRQHRFAVQAVELADRVAVALRPLATAENFDLATLSDLLAETGELLAGDGDLWSGADGEAAAALLRDMGEHGAALGRLERRDAPRAMSVLMSGRECAPARGGHPRLAILGPLEARLQRRDLMILGGLVEGVWPATAPEDAFLSRSMRRTLKLPAPEVRIGLAAHDFAQLACAPEVLMTRAAVRNGAPAVKSRWLWRLETLARAAGKEALFAPAPNRNPVALSRLLDAPARTLRITAPRPRPPADSRPQRISFTEVEKLIRDPYAIYARRVLGLEPLDLPGAKVDARQRGTAIHKAIEVFGDGDDASTLLDLLDRELAENGFDAARRRTERARLAFAASAYVSWLGERRNAGVRSYREVNAQLDLGAGRRLYGRADAIDVHAGNRADVVDFKSGSPPSASQVKSGLSPQMTLEAAALAAGAFESPDLKRAGIVATGLIYWQFGGAAPGECVVMSGPEVKEQAALALSRLQALLQAYGHADQPYLSKPRVQFLNAWDDYDHFARRAEWADAEGAE